MPPHNAAVIRFPRLCGDVLADLQEAVRDLADALTAIASDEDADDRATEAEQRVERLRAEFDEQMVRSTGLSVEDIRKAYEGALL